MNILQLTDSLQIGGAEVIAGNLAAGLAARGHSCQVCGLGLNGELAAILEKYSVRSYALLTPFGVSPKLMWRIADIANRENSDLLVTHHFRQLAHGLLPGLLGGRKIIHVEHDYHFYENKPALISRLSWMLRFVDVFVVVSQDMGDWFSKNIPHAGRKIAVIQNGIDCERFRPDMGRRASMRQRYRIDEHAVVIGTCARLEAVKNISLLIDAFDCFSRRNPAAMLCIVGTGSLMQQLKEQARECSLSGKIIFAGVQHAVEDFLAMFDIYAITSSNEGLPVSVLEAMSSALPVVATNVGSLSDLVTGETGILLDHPDAHELGSAIEYFASNRAAAHDAGAKGRNFAAERYSLQVMVQQYEAAFLNAGQ